MWLKVANENTQLKQNIRIVTNKSNLWLIYNQHPVETVAFSNKYVAVMEKVLDNEHLMECIKGYLVIYHRGRKDF